MKEINKAIEPAINFIKKEQLADGSFWCLVSTKLDDYSDSRRVPAIVPTNIVLSSLNKLDSQEFPKIDLIKKKAADFLVSERGQYWSFNYWFRKSDWFKEEPYPDDTDDTFCALSALREYDPSIFDGEAMALIVTMLTSSEKAEGGPYDMWLVPADGRGTWSDLDLVCNSNIAFFLSLEGISLPKVDAFIEKSIDDVNYEFPYNKIYPGVYFVSRFYKGKKSQKIIDLLLSKQEKSGKWENPLRTALAISSLINLSGMRDLSVGMHDPNIVSSVKKGIDYLIWSQEADGSWPVHSFYYQMKTPQKTLFAGSATTTTALCIEALNKFAQFELNVKQEAEAKALKESQKKFGADGEGPKDTGGAKSTRAKSQIFHATDIQAEDYKKIYNSIVRLVKKTFDGYPSLKQEARKSIDAMLEGDKAARGGVGDEIVLLPYLFRDSLRKNSLNIKKNTAPGAGNAKDISLISDDLLVQLGAANLFGWLAYTIYDDFLDGEGDPRKLSIANVCHREAVLIFNGIGFKHNFKNKSNRGKGADNGSSFADNGFGTFAIRTLNTIDEANAWESLNCRFDVGGAGNADKSVGNKDNKISIPDFADYSQLANRSLGHTLGPAAILFELSYGETSKEFSKVMGFFKHYIIARQLNDDAHDWEDDLKRGQVNSVSALMLGKNMAISMDQLRQHFWNKTIVTVCKKTIQRITLSKKNLDAAKAAGIIKNSKIFDKMLSRIEKQVQKTLEERKETLKFLNTYGKGR